MPRWRPPSTTSAWWSRASSGSARAWRTSWWPGSTRSPPSRAPTGSAGDGRRRGRAARDRLRRRELRRRRPGAPGPGRGGAARRVRDRPAQDEGRHLRTGCSARAASSGCPRTTPACWCSPRWRAPRPALQLAELLGVEPDVVFDVTVEGNRPDAWSMAGHRPRPGGPPRTWPSRRPDPAAAGHGRRPGGRAGDRCEVDDPDLCPRITARVLPDVAVGPSPAVAGPPPGPGRHAADQQRGRRLQLRDARAGPAHPPLRPRPPGRGRAAGAPGPAGETLVTLDGVERALGTPAGARGHRRGLPDLRRRRARRWGSAGSWAGSRRRSRPPPPGCCSRRPTSPDGDRPHRPSAWGCAPRRRPGSSGGATRGGSTGRRTGSASCSGAAVAPGVLDRQGEVPRPRHRWPCRCRGSTPCWARRWRGRRWPGSIEPIGFACEPAGADLLVTVPTDRPGRAARALRDRRRDRGGGPHLRLLPASPPAAVLAPARAGSRPASASAGWCARCSAAWGPPRRGRPTFVARRRPRPHGARRARRSGWPTRWRPRRTRCAGRCCPGCCGRWPTTPTAARATSGSSRWARSSPTRTSRPPGGPQRRRRRLGGGAARGAGAALGGAGRGRRRRPGRRCPRGGCWPTRCGSTGAPGGGRAVRATPGGLACTRPARPGWSGGRGKVVGAVGEVDPEVLAGVGVGRPPGGLARGGPRAAARPGHGGAPGPGAGR